MGPERWNFSLPKAVDAITASNKTEPKQRSMGNTIAEGIWIRNCLAKRCWFDWVASGRIRGTQESEVRSLKSESELRSIPMQRMCRILHSTHALVSEQFTGSDVAEPELTIVVSVGWSYSHRLANAMQVFGSASAT